MEKCKKIYNNVSILGVSFGSESRTGAAGESTKLDDGSAGSRVQRKEEEDQPCFPPAELFGLCHAL